MLEKLTIFLLMVASAVVYVNAEAPIWRAQQESVYEPSESNPDRLTLSFTAFHTFNANGQPLETTTITVDGQRQRTIITYTDSLPTLELTEALVNGQWEPLKLRRRTYDPLTGIITLNEELNYIDGKERPGNCYKRRIERNAAGNVTEVAVAVLFNGAYDDTQRMVVTPSSITVSELTYDGVGYVWRKSEEYSDIAWERTNGQIVSSDDLFSGANRLLSARYVNDNGNKPYYDYEITASYGDGNDFDCTMRGLYQGLENAEVVRQYRETVNGDSTLTTYAMTTSYDVVGSEEPAELYREEMQVDSWGIETLYVATSWLEGDEEHEIDFERVASVEYDAAHGYPLRVESSEDGTPLTRVDYSRYVDCSQLGAIRSVGAEGKALPVYFNLGGQRVSPSARGWKFSPGSKVFNRTNL